MNPIQINHMKNITTNPKLAALVRNLPMLCLAYSELRLVLIFNILSS